jgi:hypothetical protein
VCSGGLVAQSPCSGKEGGKKEQELI